MCRKIVGVTKTRGINVHSRIGDTAVVLAASVPRNRLAAQSTNDQAPMTNDQCGKRSLISPHWSLGFGHCSFVWSLVLGHWSLDSIQSGRSIHSLEKFF